jgi:hypothetical protein
MPPRFTERESLKMFQEFGLEDEPLVPCKDRFSMLNDGDNAGFHKL